MVFASILHIAKTRPFAFGMVYSAAKTCACDFLVQKVVEKREEVDWKRNMAFGTFGLVYLGGIQYAIYVPLFSRMFPGAAKFAAQTIKEKLANKTGLRTLGSQVFLDQFVHHPILYFPVFYLIKDVVTSDSPNPMHAIDKYKENMSEDLIALWKIWVPSTILNFAFMPMWARIPWVATTSAIWTCILSAMRGSQDLPVVEGAIIGPHVDATSFELFHRKEVNPVVVLDPSNGHMLVTLCGPDQPGIIAELSQIVFESGGSITTTKAMHLGQQFTVQMHVECPLEKKQALNEQLNQREVLGCRTFINELKPLENPSLIAKRKPYEAEFRLTGPDRPGLIFKLSQILTKHGLNIESLNSDQHRYNPFSIQTDVKFFSFNGIVTSDHVPDAEAQALMKDDLALLQKELGVICEIQNRRRA